MHLLAMFTNCVILSPGLSLYFLSFFFAQRHVYSSFSSVRFSFTLQTTRKVCSYICTLVQCFVINMKQEFKMSEHFWLLAKVCLLGNDWVTTCTCSLLCKSVGNLSNCLDWPRLWQELVDFKCLLILFAKLTESPKSVLCNICPFKIIHGVVWWTTLRAPQKYKTGLEITQKIWVSFGKPSSQIGFPQPLQGFRLSLGRKKCFL